MEYQNGLELNDIISEIVTLVLKPVPDKFSTVVEDFCDINFVKERIIMVAVNAAKNQELLNEVPHQIKLDLALIYKVVLDTTATVLVKMSILNGGGLLQKNSIHMHRRELKNYFHRRFSQCLTYYRK